MLAGAEHNNVIGNKLTDLDLLSLSVTDNSSGGLEQAFEGGVSTLSLVLLDETQNSIKNDDHHDNGKVAVFTNGERDGRGDQDYVNQRVFELIKENLQGRSFLARGENIFAILTAPFLDLGSCEAIKSRGGEHGYFPLQDRLPSSRGDRQ